MQYIFYASEGSRTKDLRVNIICYADDILLCTLNASGLQKMIHTAKKYIESNRLRFNPNRTKCHILGQNPFTSKPQWTIGVTLLSVDDTLIYLGTVAGTKMERLIVQAEVEQQVTPVMPSKVQELSSQKSDPVLPWIYTKLVSKVLGCMDVLLCS